VRFIKEVVSDILYVSKLTGTKNKKRLIAISITFSQLSAAVDIFIIGLFAYLITGQQTQITFLDLTAIFFEKNPIFILFIVILRFLFMFFQSYILRKIEFDVTKNLKEFMLQEVFDKRSYSVSDSYFYINELSGHIGYFYSNFAGFVNHVLQVLILGTYLIVSNLFVLSIFGFGTILLFFPIKKIIKISRNYVDKSYSTMRQSMDEIERVVENVFLIKILKKENEEIKKFSTTLELLNSHLMNNHSFNLINGYLPSFLTLFILGIIISFFKSVTNLTLDFIGVTLKLFNSFSLVSISFSNIMNSHVHITKFKDLQLNKKKLVNDNFVIEKINEIVFDNVTFSYEGVENPIFKDLNLKLPKQKHIIITGDNGSGKSTLLGLASGIYFANNGLVSSFSNKFGYVSAQPYIFKDSLRSNLVYGSEKKNVLDSDLLSLLTKFKVFKSQSENDLNRQITNKSLSSGQMQKIGFIRAIISQPDVILLDESTSNLDYNSKLIVFKILKEQKITIINSTHDPENFDFADLHIKINVVDGQRKVSIDS